MIPVSVVIITKNEACAIGTSISAAKHITDDVVIIDNGSSDDTLAIASRLGCRVYRQLWEGYGANKNRGIALAKYDWIFSLDADEVPDIELIQALKQIDLNDADVVYDLKYRSYFGKKRIRFGHWGRDHHVRLFNRQMVRWSEPKVHEQLILPEHINIKKVNGYVHHYSVKDAQECMAKAVYYAKLSAENNFIAGKKPGLVSRYISPIFGFLVNYIVFLGVLDGKEGWLISKSIFKNKWLKYNYPVAQKAAVAKKEYANGGFAVEYR